MSAFLLTSQDMFELVRRVGVDEFMDELIVRLTASLASYDGDRTEIPLRSGFDYREPQFGLIEWMPLMQRGERVLMKMVGYHPRNGVVHGLPTILSTMSLFDTSTGRLTAIADGTLLTAMRTGAASAVASRALALPESRSIGLIGCGAQAVTQLQALCRSYDCREVWIHDVDPNAVADYPERVSAFLDPAVKIRPAAANDVVAQSDILCVATSVEVGAGPVFDAVATRPWLHINAVGSDFPGKVEIPVSLLRESFVVADSIEQARVEGECQQLGADEIGGTLAELARDREKWAPQRAGRTVFDSTGWALEDYVALELAIEFAGEFGLGRRIELEATGDAPRDPYGFLASKPAPASSW